MVLEAILIGAHFGVIVYITWALVHPESFTATIAALDRRARNWMHPRKAAAPADRQPGKAAGAAPVGNCRP